MKLLTLLKASLGLKPSKSELLADPRRWQSRREIMRYDQIRLATLEDGRGHYAMLLPRELPRPADEIDGSVMLLLEDEAHADEIEALYRNDAGLGLREKFRRIHASLMRHQGGRWWSDDGETGTLAAGEQPPALQPAEIETFPQGPEWPRGSA